MKKKTVAVLFGGESSEYEVSLQSASGVIRAIDREKYDLVLVGITRNGEWMEYVGDVKCIENDTWFNHDFCHPVILSPDKSVHGLISKTRYIHVDVAFPVLHGKNGEDGTVQGLLQLAGIPCAGCGVLSSALCMDKVRAHKLVSLEGIRTAKSEYVKMNDTLSSWKKEAERIGYPVFVKPVCSGSSCGITKVKQEKELEEAVKEAFKFDDEVIIEEMIPGFEIGCAVLGNDEIIIGEVDEIELAGEFFDYAGKYITLSSTTHLPARIPMEKREEAKEKAKLIYRALGCRGFARVDMFYTPDQEIVFNEVNTIPGFTAHSRFPRMMKETGWTFEQIVDKILELAVKE